MDPEIIPSVNAVDFLRREVMLAELNTWAIGMVGVHNFGIKFWAGRARPEEVVWWIHQANQNNPADLIAWEIPDDIVTSIAAMNLQHPYDFTAYAEGSPTHPTWPAMHSAASVASFWLPIVMNLSHEETCEAMVSLMNG